LEAARVDGRAAQAAQQLFEAIGQAEEHGCVLRSRAWNTPAVAPCAVCRADIVEFIAIRNVDFHLSHSVHAGQTLPEFD
jgi:cytidine deaminase